MIEIGKFSDNYDVVSMIMKISGYNIPPKDFQVLFEDATLDPYSENETNYRAFR